MSDFNNIYSNRLSVWQQDVTSAEDLIFAFQQADENLKAAIEFGVDSSVEGLSKEVDNAVEMMFAFESSSSSEKRILLGFLLDHFILSSNRSNGILKKVCEKLINEM